MIDIGRKQTQIISEFTNTVERLRLKRRRGQKRRSGGVSYRYTQEELCQLVYPSYKNLLIGRTQNIPTRSTVMEMADYLQCTFDERNDLLIAARYMPERNDLKGEQLAAAIEHARQIMLFLPYPAMLLTRDWKIHDYNPGFLGMYGINDERQVPKKGKSLFHVTFDPRLPFRERNTVELAEWQKLAASTIGGFKHKNLLFRHEDWYQRRIKHSHALPDFSEYWNHSDAKQMGQSGDSFTGVVAAGPNGVPIRYTQGLLTLVDTGCPTILLYLPADDAARHVFSEIGCATHWNAQLPPLQS
ncbi:MAG: hypothetical protein ACPG8W_04405 [Candidatus Promineifilaceae bacterium]